MLGTRGRRVGAGNNWWLVFEVTFIVKHPVCNPSPFLIVLKYDGQNKAFNMLEKSSGTFTDITRTKY